MPAACAICASSRWCDPVASMATMLPAGNSASNAEMVPLLLASERPAPDWP
jgi:hypothetical protein